VRAIMPGIDGGAVEGVGTGVRADGTFRLRLPPGEYELTAHATRPNPKGAESSSESSQLFGITRLTVDGDVAGVVIQLGPGATATGRIVFEGASPLPNIPPRVESMWVVRQSGDGSNCRQGQVTLAPDFTFTVDGLFGTCTASRTGPFGRWFLKSVTFDGQEWLDRTVTFNTGQRFRDVQIVLTDRPTEAAFEVADGRGQPTRDFVGLLFSVDRSRWTNESLSVREFVPGRVGRSGSSSTEEKRAHPDVIRGLPAGDYFAVAIDDIDPELVRDPATLEKLSRAAVRITLVDGLTTVLRLSRTSRPE